MTTPGMKVRVTVALPQQIDRHGSDYHDIGAGAVGKIVGTQRARGVYRVRIAGREFDLPGELLEPVDVPPPQTSTPAELFGPDIGGEG